MIMMMIMMAYLMSTMKMMMEMEFSTPMMRIGMKISNFSSMNFFKSEIKNESFPMFDWLKLDIKDFQKTNMTQKYDVYKFNVETSFEAVCKNAIIKCGNKL